MCLQLRRKLHSPYGCVKEKRIENKECHFTNELAFLRGVFLRPPHSPFPPFGVAARESLSYLFRSGFTFRPVWFTRADRLSFGEIFGCTEIWHGMLFRAEINRTNMKFIQLARGYF